ncbi:MAG: OsmC family protein [Candidatus Limnocylindrales bacterium]
MRTVTVDWQPDQDRFEAHGTHAEWLVHMNAPHAEGGPTGFSPAEMLLAGAGGCSAWDVVEILRKQRQRISAIRVVVGGEQASQPPYAFVRVSLEYHVSGHHLNEAKVRRAVEMSEQRYCSVIGTIRGVAEVTCDVVVHDAGEDATGPTIEAAATLSAPD